MKLLKTTAAVAVLALMTGCASVNMAPQQESSQAKQFEAPPEGMAGVYIFRKKAPFGAALKKDIWIDDECVGESARGVFFYQPVEGDQQHEIATESEFSPNTMNLFAEAGNNYFIEQYIKMGAFVGGANLRLVDEEVGMEEVSKLDMAHSGTCSQ
ncbi:DUF2846 domain-containing protein [Billgrantia saliphila]|uniref:DUF2846 domain-containing protein n=1 Tax=Billgrantia saliphila TaxID=1848458 RepID=UPI000CE480CA|nr:DUF2846 domain-containing protein [Halomonas saliphila]